MNNLSIKQFEIGNYKNFTYIISCTKTNEAAIIDAPEGADTLIDILKKNNLKLKYIINTHNHNDHIADNEIIKSKTNALIIMHELDNKLYKKADKAVIDNEILALGNLSLKVIHTPGHTPGGICIYIENHLFTGDTLFVGDSGRTDLPGGDRKLLGQSIRKLMQLPGNTVIYPGHNYGVSKTSTLDNEKKYNVNAVEYGFALK